MRQIESENEIDIEKWKLSNGFWSDSGRKIRAAIDGGKAYKSTGESMRCPCGYEGRPEVIVEYEFEGEEHHLFYCPNCGDA